MVGSLQKHNWLQNKLYTHPEILGIQRNSIIAKTKEYELYYKGHIITVPDLYYVTPSIRHYIEIKSGNNTKLYDKGMSQLEKIALWADSMNITNFESKLIMPNNPSEKIWIDMLDNLKVYKLGDSYSGQ